ncbi:MAG: response regulator transcription factor [Lachnospiraceae bacterium]|nr:response regulator transcription factor [Lachnospiraceae bacterium]
MNRPVNVLICDDQNIPRLLFKMMIDNSDRYRLAGELSVADDAVDFISQHEVDLCIIDVVMQKGSNGLKAAGDIKKKYPGVRIIVTTSMPDDSYLKYAREIGVESFWYKEMPDMTLLEVMNRTMNGESVYPDEAPVVEIGWMKSNELTDRELDVLRLMTEGLTDQEIADTLNIGKATVRTHINHMCEKSGLSRVRLAIEARLLGVAICDS